MTQTPQTPPDIKAIEQLAAAKGKMLSELHKAIVGQDAVIALLLEAMLSRGHCLLVGVPGLAKTLMISTLASVLKLSFNRIQFTPDLMPADITGTDVIEEDRTTGRRAFRFVKGPIFANVILADEINRTPPKTQAALLQAMQEYHVTAGGNTYPLELPFFVLATQNPIEQEGTYPLPEAQLDRFMFMVQVDYPSREEERLIVKATTTETRPSPQPVLAGSDILALQQSGPPAPGLPACDRLCGEPHPRQPADRPHRPAVHQELSHLGRRAACGPVPGPGGQEPGAAGGPVQRLLRRYPRRPRIR